MKIEYPKCLNGNCMHNDKYLCKSDGLNEDIVCKLGKADAITSIKSSTIDKKLACKLSSS